MYDTTELKGVETTLFAALKIKRDEYYHKKPILKDELAKDIFENLNLVEKDFRLNRFSTTAALYRAKKLDQYVREFIEANPDGLVIDLGCGLDPRFYRLDNERICWIDIDLPEVINLKKKLLKGNPRYHMIGKSITDFSWLDEALAVKKTKTILVSEGVLMYLEKDQVIRMFKAISSKLKGSILVFDLCSELLTGKRFVRMLKKAQTVFQWGANDSLELINERNGCQLIEEWRYYDEFHSRYGIANLFHFIPALNNMFRIAKCQFTGREGEQ